MGGWKAPWTVASALALTLCGIDVSWGQTPTIKSAVTVYAGPVISQNTWVEIRGTNLVPATAPASGRVWSDAPEFAYNRMPTELDGISVTINGRNAYIYFFCSSSTHKGCASDQINVLTPPDDTQGAVQVVVYNKGIASAPYTATMRSSSPSFFQWSGKYAAATHADGSLLGPADLFPGYSTPAKPNETITLWMTGFGRPVGGIVPGSATQYGTLPFNPTILFNGTPAAISFAGVVGPGLYQINLTVPANATNGDVSVTVEYGGYNGPAGSVISVTAPNPSKNVTLRLKNNLVYPVDFTYAGAVIARVDAQSSVDKTLSVGSSLAVSFNMVQPTLDGRALGDPITGYFDTIDNPSGTIPLTVGATLKTAWFFAPRIYNKTGTALLMGVNMGLQSENRCNCTVPANTDNVHLGYYRYYLNSNVRAYLPGSNYSGSYVYFGQDSNSPNGTITGVDPDTGLVSLTLTQAPSGGGGGAQPTSTYFIDDTATLTNQGAWRTQDFTLSRTTTLVFRLAADYAAQAAIMTPDQKYAFQNNLAFTGYAVFDKKFGTQWITLQPGSYFVGVRNAVQGANTVRLELDYDVSFPGLSRYDSATYSQTVPANGGKYYQAFSIQSGIWYWVDGCNSGMDVFLIPESELSNFLGNKTFQQYSLYSGVDSPELPGGYEVKLPPGNYYFVFRNQSTVGKTFTMTIERWR